MSDRGVLGRLGASLGLFTIAVDILIEWAIQAEGAKLDCGTVDLVAVSRHADGFELIKHAARMVDGCTGDGLRGRGGGPGGVVLVLRSGERGGRRAGRRAARVPGIGSFAGGSFGLGRVRDVGNLVEVLLGKLILGRHQRDLGDNGNWDGRDRRNHRDRRGNGLDRGSRSRLFLGLRGGLLDGGRDLRLGFGRLGSGQRFNGRFGGFDRGLLRLRGRLRDGRLPQHARPGGLCARCNGCDARRSCRESSGGLCRGGLAPGGRLFG